MASKKSEKDRSSDYPLMLYREGGSLAWDGRNVDSMIVNDEGEEDEAAKDGWVRSFEGD